jgi:hypothetical protein
MASRIPTIIAESNLDGGPTGPYADANAFSGGAQGLYDLGQGVSNLGAAADKIARDNEQRWVSSASGQFLEESAGFLEDEKNKSREDFGEATKEHLNKLRGDYLKKAPSKRAADALSSHLSTFIASQERQARRLGANNRITNQSVEIDTTIAQTMRAFRATADTEMIVAQRQRLLEQVDSTFGEISPAAAGKLRENIDKQFVQGVAAQNPAAARQLLDVSTNINENDRRLLGNIIDDYENAAMAEHRTVVRDSLMDSLATAKLRNQPVARPDDSIFSVFGKSAETTKSWFVREADAHDRALGILGDIKDKNASYQQQKLQELADKGSGQSDLEAITTAARKVDDAARRQAQDPAGWQLENQLDVYQAFQKAEASGDPNDMATAFNLSLQYQGAAPEGATPQEAAKYLDLPTHARHLMSKAQATQRSREIRQGSASEQVAALNAMKQSFKRKEHWAQAYNDLVTLPPEGQGIPQELQLAFLIDDPAVQKQFIGAISNTEGIKGLTEDSRTEFKEKLEGDKLWRAFQRSMVGDMFGGTIPLEGYRDGILKYAYALSVGGAKTSDAVKTALQNTIGNHIGFTEVNGQTIAVPKQRAADAYGPQLPPRSDEEVQDLGRRMALAVRELDTRSVKLTDDTGRSILPLSNIAPEGIERDQFIRDAITSRGYFVSEADGESVTLYLMGDNGVGVQLRDKSGQPFELYLDSLPSFSSKIVSPIQLKQIDLKEQPQKTYDISGFEPSTSSMPDLVKKLVGYQRRTNWPVTGNFWINQMQKPGYKLPPHALKPDPILP